MLRYVLMVDETVRRIRANRAKARTALDKIEQLDAELPALIRAAFDAGRTWQELAQELGVGKARIYQLRAQKD